jgi:hypothetical protein
MWSQRFSSLSERMMARSLAGMAGGATQTLLGEGISQHRLASGEELANSMLTGAVMNNALPAFHSAVGKGVDWANVKTGRGIPLDRVLETRIELPQPSETLNRLVAENRWARVLPGDQPAARTTANKISLAELTPEELAHELAHLSAHRQESIQSGYRAAADHLAVDDVASARRMFLDTRLKEEINAVLAGETVRAETAGRSAELPGMDELRRDVPKRLTAAGKSYEQVWEEEFQRFADSGGKQLPDAHYGGVNLREPVVWFSTLSQWDQLTQTEQLSFINKLQFAPESARNKFWYNAIRDNDPELRKAACEAISKLPPKQRFAAWLEI